MKKLEFTEITVLRTMIQYQVVCFTDRMYSTVVKRSCHVVYPSITTMSTAQR